MKSYSPGEDLGGLLKYIGNVEISGPSDFSMTRDGFAVQGASVEMSKRFKAFFHSNARFALVPTRIHAWRLEAPSLEGMFRAIHIYAAFPQAPMALVELGHLNQLLIKHVSRKTSNLLSEAPPGNICFAFDKEKKVRTILLSRTKPGLWSLGAPASSSANADLEDRHRPGTIVLSSERM